MRRTVPLASVLFLAAIVTINGPLWHCLLNCGFRLPASAGTDVFLNRLRVRLHGGDRAYVRLDAAFSYPAWVRH